MPKTYAKLPDADFLRGRFSYDRETGDLSIRFGQYAGHVLKTPNTSGHFHVRIERKSFLVHRIIWKMMTGKDPVLDIDHEDTNTQNNRWENLREATNSQNMANRPRQKNNTTGFKGVGKFRGRYYAQIRKDRKLRFLGAFDSAEEAHLAYVRAAAELFGEFSRPV